MARPGGLKAAVVLALDDATGSRTRAAARGISTVIPLTDPSLLTPDAGRVPTAVARRAG